MAITQQRTYELEEDDGTITGTWVLVDNEAWTEPRKVSLSSIIESTHTESSQLSNLGSSNVSVVYGTPFQSIAVDDISVYRVFSPQSGKEVRETVRVYNLVSTLTGFSLVIDDSEDLEGVVVSYMIMEG